MSRTPFLSDGTGASLANNRPLASTFVPLLPLHPQPVHLHPCLTCPPASPQTLPMHNSFLVFDFGANEDAAQQARHKLDRWKQAFRLDKKLLYKFDRQEQPASAAAANPPLTKERPAPAKGGKDAKPKPAKASAKSAKSAAKKKDEPEATSESSPSSDITLLVRLYFSGHEKLSYHRWVERIPAEEPFKTVRHELVNGADSRYAEFDQRFQSLD